MALVPPLLGYFAVYDAEFTVTFKAPGCAVLFLARDDVDVGCNVLVCEFFASGDGSCCAEEADIADEGADGVGNTGVV